MLVLAVLGLSGGIPNLLATSIAPAWTTISGWEVEAIGLLAFLQLPYALKFLWAPVVDRVRLPFAARLGQRRSWILVTQAGAIAAILAVAAWGPGNAALPDAAASPGDAATAATESSHAMVFMCLLALLVFFSATQDIVADAYRTESLTPSEFGAGAGVFVSGYRVAFVALGAIVLVLAPKISWPVAVSLLALVAGYAMICTLAGSEPANRAAPVSGTRAAILQPFVLLARRWRWRLVALVAFVLIFRLPDQMGNAMTTPLILNGLGYSPEQLGWVRQAFGFTLTIFGALAGGWMVARIGLLKCLIAFGILQAVSNAGFLLLADAFAATTAHAAATPAPLSALIGVIAIENFSGGLVSAGFVAFLMSVCDRTQVATQYALLTALMALGGAIAGGASGYLAAHFDYPAFFLITILVGIPGIALIAGVRSPK